MLLHVWRLLFAVGVTNMPDHITAMQFACKSFTLSCWAIQQAVHLVFFFMVSAGLPGEAHLQPARLLPGH